MWLWVACRELLMELEHRSDMFLPSPSSTCRWSSWKKKLEVWNLYGRAHLVQAAPGSGPGWTQEPD